MYQDIINTLLSDDYYKIKKNINELINNQDFIKKITNIHNPIVFDRFIKMCEYKVDTSILYDERNKFIRENISKLNNTNIYEFFDINNLDKEHKEIIANRYLTEYIINYYFGDNYYNFMTNFYQMLTYLKRTKKDLVSKEHIKLYKEFVDLNHMSLTDKIGFFNLLLDDINIMVMFYDDMNTVREDSHKELVLKSLKLNHSNKIYNKDISEKLKIDVYNLDGEPFFGFVRCLAIPRGNLFNYYREVNAEDGRLGYSFSYIGDKNIGTIDYDGKGVTLFYDNIDYKNIMYVHHGDLHSKKMNTQNDYLSIKENEMVTPESLIAHTKNYNEIYIKTEGKENRPKALICYDVIDDKDIAFAKKYHVDLLVINRSKYKRYEEYEDDYDDYTYNI